MTQKIEVQARAPKDPDGTFERIGSDEEGHEFLIDLYFDSPEQANGTMADRFPSLDDFAAGEPLHNPFLLVLSQSPPVQSAAQVVKLANTKPANRPNRTQRQRHRRP